MAGEANEDIRDLYLRNLQSMERMIEKNKETMGRLEDEYSKMRRSSNPERERELARIASEHEAAGNNLFLLHARAQKLRELLGSG